MKEAQDRMNILVTLDRNYIPYLNVMLSSLLHSNPECRFDVYLLHSSIREEDLADTRRILSPAGRLLPICAGDIPLENAPVTDRYPREIYYRIFAARYLPAGVDRILYMDPDIVVNGSVRRLYHMPLGDFYFAAASHTGRFLHAVNELRLDMEEDSPYINSGLMLMNLQRLRAEQDYGEVFRFIREKDRSLLLPDQDIISGLYGSRICALDPFRYNMTERLFRAHAPFEKDMTLDWIRKNSVIIHYCGRNKPWKAEYIGKLDVFYHEAAAEMRRTLGEAEKDRCAGNGKEPVRSVRSGQERK